MRSLYFANRALHVCIIFCALSIPAAAADYGPTNGHLVIVGGAMNDPAILERFIELAGGSEVPFVVIPTAGGNEHYDQYWTGLSLFKQAGVENITVLHTSDRTVADSEEFVKPIREARGVWFSGGRQWRLVDSYSNTLTHKELHALLERGGVIGGSSAGATIQGSYLVRGDTKTNTIMMGDHEEGMGFLRQSAIDQHLLMRNRHFDLIEVIEAHPDLLGIGLDEDTAIVVSGDSFSVIGQGYVAIYDSQRRLDSGGKFYFLAPGDRFNMATRQAMRRTMSEAPFERVKEKKWKEQ